MDLKICIPNLHRSQGSVGRSGYGYRSSEWAERNHLGPCLKARSGLSQSAPVGQSDAQIEYFLLTSRYAQLSITAVANIINVLRS